MAETKKATADEEPAPDSCGRSKGDACDLVGPFPCAACAHGKGFHRAWWRPTLGCTLCEPDACKQFVPAPDGTA